MAWIAMGLLVLLGTAACWIIWRHWERKGLIADLAVARDALAQRGRRIEDLNRENIELHRALQAVIGPPIEPPPGLEERVMAAIFADREERSPHGLDYVDMEALRVLDGVVKNMEDSGRMVAMGCPPRNDVTFFGNHTTDCADPACAGCFRPVAPIIRVGADRQFPGARHA